MSESRIAQALAKLFEVQRIVFWTNPDKELRGEFEALALPAVEKLEIANNEYALKYQILRKQPKQKFLLYREGAEPEQIDNWLLDVQLAHAEFRTDQVALWLADLELGPRFAELIQSHAEFCQEPKRIQALKTLLKPDDTPGLIRLKMLAICASSEPRLDSILENLLQELADDRTEKISLIGRCNLDGFLWEQLSRHYGYKSPEPNVNDFAIELFKSCYAMATDGTVKLTGDALVFLKRWKDSRLFEASFEKLSNQCAEILGIENDVASKDFRDLIEIDYFDKIDRQVIRELVKAVAARTVTSVEVTNWVRHRRQGHWYQKYSNIYEAIDFAAQFMTALSEADLTMTSFVDGIQRYSSSWYRLDQLYRKFTYHARLVSQASLLGDLANQVENLYSNNYVLKLNDDWQRFVDDIGKWEAPPIVSQKNFFQLMVEPFLRKENKVCIVISDAMRFEVGEELLNLITKEDRYTAEIQPALSMLPSYTQLGMAALLPNTELSIADNETGTVLVEGQSSQGTANRKKILSNALQQRATAKKSEEIMELKGDDCRTLLREHDVIYIYHDRIDHTGDKLGSEAQVFEAVEQTLQDLMLLIKKLTGANASNIIVTADHGFIYQNRALEESDFTDVEAIGKQILYRNRRFVIGKGLKQSSSLRKFTSAELGLTGNLEVQIPKSINRIRVKGSGSRFVHGGASLQEIVIPVIKINKKRQSDISLVEVDILRGSSSVITSGQLAVGLYQVKAVKDKVQPRVLRAGIYTEAGDLISDSHELTFDLASDNPRDREIPVRFVLTHKADEVNGQEVILKLEEKHAGTSHFREYKSIRYQVRRSFTSDYDF